MKKGTLLLLAILCMTGVWAQAQETLDLEKALQMGLENNLQVKIGVEIPQPPRAGYEDCCRKLVYAYPECQLPTYFFYGGCDADLCHVTPIILERSMPPNPKTKPIVWLEFMGFAQSQW